MQTDQKKMFTFKTFVNGFAFDFNRVAESQMAAAKSLADDLTIVVQELREIEKAKTGVN